MYIHIWTVSKNLNVDIHDYNTKLIGNTGHFISVIINVIIYLILKWILKIM